MKNFIQRSLAYFLSFIGLMIGFTSKVLAQYGAPVMHFKLLGQVRSAECEQPIGGIEVTLVNDASGEVTKVRTDSNGNFNFRIIEYYWEKEFTMNLSDLDGPENKGAFVSKSVHFQLNDKTKVLSANYWHQDNQVAPMPVFLDFEGTNPCLPASETQPEPEMPVIAPREEEIFDIESEPKPEVFPPIPGIFQDAVLYPNPSDGRFGIEFTLTESCEISVSLFTLSGQLIDKFFYKAEQGNHYIPVHAGLNASQVILVQLNAKDQSIYFRHLIN
jgi:putative lipoprotein (rSAM/lipoprotein system)